MKGISHLAIGVSDMERSLPFYRDLLGLEVMLDAEEKVVVGGFTASKYVIPPTLTDFMLFIPCGDTMVVIYPGRNDDPVGGKTSGMDLFNQVLGTFHFPTQ